MAAPCAQSGASQLLLIVDTCFSGGAVTAGELAVRIMQRSPPEAEYVWVGVLASCLPEEVARDGLFARRLAGLLESGPEPGPGTRALLVQRWSPQSAYIRGDDLCDAVLKTRGTPAHTPDFLSHGSAWWMFPNPRYDPGAPERVVEHLLLAARGGAPPGEQSWFTGRAAEVGQVVAWVRSHQPGLHVLTGSAGTGKTAIAGRVVSLSNPAERERLLAEGRVLGHADPGERSVAAHVHARALTTDRAADSIAGQLVRAGVLAAQPDRRNAAELVGQLQRAAEQGAAAPVLVVDGLDEARGQAFAIAEELLLRLAPYATVIVSTRELRRGQTEPSLLDVLTAGAAELDLDDPAGQQRGRVAMRAYIARRLAGVDPAMDPDAVAGHLAGETSMTGGSPFLLARLVTDQLRACPVDTSQPGWQDQVSHSIQDAFDADLAQARAPGESARTLLAALTWGFGAGLPEEEWLACANALGDGGLGRDDVTGVLDQVGRYIIQDGEAGVAVYRIAHQSLADHIRPPFAAAHQQVFDPQAPPVAAALLGRYAELLANGVPVTGPGYLWRYAWRHAATAGPAGLELIRGLAAGESRLLPAVAMVGQEVGGRLASWGYRLEALAPTEEAVRLYRELAEANPAFLPGLADALTNLGIRYSEVGRRQDALAPAEEAVQLYQELAETNPAFLPDLASALGNLGTRYSEVGRRQDALAPAEEAVQLCRELAAANPAFLPDLASALGNLGTHYSEVGRRQDALAPAVEAVQLCRELAAANPAFLPGLASALNNLGTRYRDVGRRQDALAPTEEAVRLYRELAAANPAFLPGLADAMNNLGVFYSGVGRRQDALAPAEEAVQLYQELAETNPDFLPDLAMALNNLGIRYSGVGRRQDALAPAEEAVQLCRELAAANPAFLPDLAGALGGLGIRYSGVGRRQDALAPTEEAVRLYQELAAANPAFLPGLAGALNNLGNHYSAVGRRQDALAPAEEAVRLYQELAETNPAFLPDLASALGNLGNHYRDVGRRQDALAPTEEAVRLYQELAETNPAFLPDLAMALNNLANRYSEAGSADRGEAAWEQAITEAAPQVAAYLLVDRAGAADAGHSAAVAWLARALATDLENRGLVDAAHEQARRHRGPDPAAFDQDWARRTGMPVPAWLTVDSALLSSARAWVATDTYTAERDQLAAHPELLEAAADPAVAEALLAVPEDEAGRYAALRRAAQHDGADAAYRPLLLTILAREFADAEPARQRALLADRADDLLTDTVADALEELAAQEDQEAVAAQRATALLNLARAGDAEPVFEALTEPGLFPRLLHELAIRIDPASAGPAAMVAYIVATTLAEAATAVFYLAVAWAARGDHDHARDLIRQARSADPAQVPAWINELAEIGQHHHGVLQLIPELTAPADPPVLPGPLSEDTR